MIDESAKLKGRIQISICLGDTCEVEILECEGKFTVAEVGTVVQRHAYQLLLQALEEKTGGSAKKKAGS